MKLKFTVKFLLIAALIFGGLTLSAMLGYRNGKMHTHYVHKKVNAYNDLAKYMLARDIAVDLQKGEIQEAKCLADLEASRWRDTVKECIEDTSCEPFIRNHLPQLAPDLLNNEPPHFNYIRQCKSYSSDN